MITNAKVPGYLLTTVSLKVTLLIAELGNVHLMTSHVFWPFLTYLPCPTLQRPILGAVLDPPTYPNIGRHLWTFPKMMHSSLV